MTGKDLPLTLQRRIASPAVPAVLAVVGLGLVVGALVTLDSHETVRTALLAAFGGLGLLSALAVALDIRSKKKAAERFVIREDGLEVTAHGRQRFHPFARLVALEGKVTLYQQTGARLHAFRLVFGDETVELTEGDLVGVDGDIGPLLARLSGRPVTAWP